MAATLGNGVHLVQHNGSTYDKNDIAPHTARTSKHIFCADG